MADKILRKISVKTVTGKSVSQIREHAEKTPNKPLMSVLGIASGYKSGESDKGPWTALTGNFLAVNDKGERFRAGVAFLDPAGMNLILAELDGPESQGVEFAFSILVKADTEAATGYCYEVASLVEPSESDPIEALASKLGKKLPALAAPKKDDEKTA